MCSGLELHNSQQYILRVVKVNGLRPKLDSATLTRKTFNFLLQLQLHEAIQLSEPRLYRQSRLICSVLSLYVRQQISSFCALYSLSNHVLSDDECAPVRNSAEEGQLYFQTINVNFWKISSYPFEDMNGPVLIKWIMWPKQATVLVFHRHVSDGLSSTATSTASLPLQPAQDNWTTQIRTQKVLFNSHVAIL